MHVFTAAAFVVFPFLDVFPNYSTAYAPLRALALDWIPIVLQMRLIPRQRMKKQCSFCQGDLEY